MTDELPWSLIAKGGVIVPAPTASEETASEENPPQAPETPTRESRGADARALTQVLFKEFSRLEPGTPEHARVRAALIEANLPLVRYAAARFRSRNEPMEDVIQVGTIGLINAIDRFDPDRGVQFPTFAMPTVVGEIKRYFRDNVRTVHVPRRLHELWVQVNGATEDLTVLHGRSPTTAEIAERLKIGEDEVLACIEAGRSYHATSLEAAQEGDGLPGLLDRIGYEDPALAGVEHRDLVRHLLVQLPGARAAHPAAALLQQSDPVADQWRSWGCPRCTCRGCSPGASPGCAPQIESMRNPCWGIRPLTSLMPREVMRQICRLDATACLPTCDILLELAFCHSAASGIQVEAEPLA
ncbi:hypothetical protein GCM10020221_35540 [Streptomyces thioluteus]|uniref:RNA polymerase sigma-70 domain-containing protein n=1 Tax=Streptomyces thioluteus TaxID=66431 RepID=A0ABN3X6E0_STRTU